MPNVLDLQGLPDNIATMAASLTNGACISLVSVVERLGNVQTTTMSPAGLASEDDNATQTANNETQPMGACISLVSYVGRSGAI